MKRLFCCLLCLTVLLQPGVCAQEDAYDGLYVVFGDSIAAGYGLNDAEEGSESAMQYVAGRDSDAYAGIVARELQYDLANYAVSGARTKDLLEVLERADVTASVRDADLITVSIGGNDLIYMSGTVLPRAVMVKAMSGITEVAPTDEAIEEMYATLEKNLTAIMRKLTQENEKGGAIYLQTLYNPFLYNATYSLPSSDTVYSLGDLFSYYIDRINLIYRRVQRAVGGFELLETAARLNADSRSYYDVSSPDIHPTAFGHALIAQTLLETYVKPTPTPPLAPVIVDPIPTAQAPAKKPDTPPYFLIGGSVAVLAGVTVLIVLLVKKKKQR